MNRAEVLLDELFGRDPAVERLLSPSRSELSAMEDAITRTRRKYEDDPTDPLIVFQYASLLISHSRESYINEGVLLMETLVHAEWEKRWGGLTHTEISEMNRRNLESALTATEDPDVVRGTVGVAASAPPNNDDDDSVDHRKESITSLAIHYYYLSVGWIKLRDFDKALTCVKQMLQLEPNHRQGLALKQYIEAVTRQTIAVTGVAGIGVVAAITAVVGILLSRR